MAEDADPAGHELEVSPQPDRLGEPSGSQRAQDVPVCEEQCAPLDRVDPGDHPVHASGDLLW